MFESFVNFFYRDELFSFSFALFILGGNNNSICALANCYNKERITNINDLISIWDLEFLFGYRDSLKVCMVVSVGFVGVDDVLPQLSHADFSYFFI